MAKRDDIIEYVNDLLKLHDYPDYGPMGLQFTGSENVWSVGTAVSASSDVIKAAWERGAQMLLVHHGLFWNNESRLLDERVGTRIQKLAGYNMNLAGYHLALDAHPVIGNNRLAAKRLNLTEIEPFAEIGWMGTANVDRRELKNRCYQTFGSIPKTYNFGPNNIQRVGVIVGGAPQYIVEAHRSGCDTFLTGEVGEPTIYIAQELKMNFIACGHHATEKAGVQAVGKLLTQRFKVASFFIDVENPA